MLGDRVGQLDRAVLERRPSAGSARAASPSPRARARRSGSVGRQKPQCTQSAISSGSTSPPRRARRAGSSARSAASSRVGDARTRPHERRGLAVPAPPPRQRLPAARGSPPSGRPPRRRATRSCASTDARRALEQHVQLGRRARSTALGTSCERCSSSQREPSITTRARGRRQRVQPQRETLDRAEPPARAAEQLAEVVAGDVLDDLAARVRARAVARARRSRRARGRASCRSDGAAARRDRRAGTRRASAIAGRVERQPLAVLGEHAPGARPAASRPRRSRSGRPARTRDPHAAGRRPSRETLRAFDEAGPLERVGAIGARDLAAQPRRREDLARVGEAARVERAAAAAPSPSRSRLAEQQRHRAGLVGADAVLAGDRAAGVDARLEDLLAPAACARSASPVDAARRRARAGAGCRRRRGRRCRRAARRPSTSSVDAPQHRRQLACAARRRPGRSSRG